MSVGCTRIEVSIFQRLLMMSKQRSKHEEALVVNELNKKYITLVSLY
jgi:hypothetical protein